MMALIIMIMRVFMVTAAHSVPKDTDLPAVTSMMNASSSTLGKISKHVTSIGLHAKDLIEEQKAKLASQKVDFENQLKLQADMNAKLEAQNEKESAQIWELEKSNDNLLAQAKKLQKDNANLRKAFKTVEAKMGAVDKFAGHALKASDDEGSADLAVLNQTDGKGSEGDQEATKEGDADQDSKDTDAGTEADSANAGDSDSTPAKDGESDEDAQSASNSTGTEDVAETDASFLAIRSRTTRARRDDDDSDSSQVDEGSDDSEVPDENTQNATSLSMVSDSAPADHKSIDMVAELKKEIAQLSEQKDKSNSELAKLFQARFQKGADKKMQILEKQKLLNSTRASLTKLHTELQGALKHLKGTKAKLENQLHGLGHYLAQLASYVSKPEPDAEKALRSLPSDVQTFLQLKS